MNILRMIVRIIVGLAFVAFGLMGLLIPPQPMPGLGGVLATALHDSHWTMFVSAAQIVAGLTFIAGRFVPLGVTILFAFLYNSIAFHTGTSPMLLPMPIVVGLLLIFIAWPYRQLFAQLFSANPPTANETTASPVSR